MELKDQVAVLDAHHRQEESVQWNWKENGRFHGFKFYSDNRNPFNGIERRLPYDGVPAGAPGRIRSMELKVVRPPGLGIFSHPLGIRSMELKERSTRATPRTAGASWESVQWNWKTAVACLASDMNMSTGIRSMELKGNGYLLSHLEDGVYESVNPFNGIESLVLVASPRLYHRRNPESVQWNWK